MEQLLARRISLIKQIVLLMVEENKEYFLSGTFLKPITQSDMAQKLEVHVSTIHRAITDKYVKTNKGTFPLKDFFTKPVDESRKYSKEQIMSFIQEICDTPFSQKYSDRMIQEILEEKEIFIARRTVSKYRKLGNIKSSYNR